jgi:CRISPR-associated endonuclease Cas1
VPRAERSANPPELEDLDEFGPEDVDADIPPITLASLLEEIDSARTTYRDKTVSGTVVADGYDLSVKVRAGCLVIEDGIHPHRRTRTIARADRDVRRVIVLGAGFITTEAMLWCHQRGLPLVVARTRTTPTMVNAAALFDHGGIRRAQALAPYIIEDNGRSVAVNVARVLLDGRLSDQARLAEQHFGRDDTADVIQALRRAVVTASRVEDLLTAEGRAADHYWSCWERLDLRFANRDLPRVPDHWRRYPGRRSALSAAGWTPRHATCPANALLNLGYKVAEIEATVSCLALGLDPSMGMAHATRQGRPSLALDLMEAGRVVVEETVLALIDRRTFRKADFTETQTGEVRVRPPLSHELVATLAPLLRDRLAPVAERMAQMIARAADGKVEVPTPLTSTRHGKVARPRKTRFARACRGCGLFLPAHQEHRSWCDGCLPEARRERNLSPVGTARKRRRPERAASSYATKGDLVRAERMAALRAEEREWERRHQGMRRPSPEQFGPIREALASFPLDTIAAAIGVSRTAAGYIRSGKQVPHIRHWSALAALAGVPDPLSEPAEDDLDTGQQIQPGTRGRREADRTRGGRYIDSDRRRDSFSP